MFHPQGPTFLELARQALSSTERGYDLLAPKFDFTPFRTPAEVLDVVGEQLRELAPFGSALDICCGTGAGMEMLRPLCGDRLVGVDFSQGMLDVARQQVTQIADGARLEFVNADVLDMPFENEFDLAVCFGAHGHILPRDEARFVQQVAQSLKAGGRFVFVTSHKPRLWNRSFWFGHGFNAAMRIRNLFIRPPFIMYYLTFCLPHVTALFERHGFAVEVRSPFAGRCARLKLIIATLAN